MSEYQYYEFQAIDRPLTDEEQKTLRRYSGRAMITATRFVNSYTIACTRPSSAAWMTCAESLRSNDEARPATERSRNLGPFSEAFLPYRLESSSTPGDRRTCLPSPYKNQRLPRCARKKVNVDPDNLIHPREMENDKKR